MNFSKTRALVAVSLSFLSCLSFAHEKKNGAVAAPLKRNVSDLIAEYGEPAYIFEYLSKVSLYVWKGSWQNGRIVFVDTVSGREFYIFPTNIDFVFVRQKKVVVTFRNKISTFESVDKSPTFHMIQTEVGSNIDKEGKVYPLFEPNLYIGNKLFILTRAMNQETSK